MATARADVELTGQTPLLMHAFPMVPIHALEKLDIAEQARLAAYIDPEGLYFVPGVNLQRALIAGATYSKGKGRASLQKNAAACLFVSPERLILTPQAYVVDSRPVVVPATKGRILRHRPRFDQWVVRAALEWDPTLLTAQQVRQIVDDTGLRVGLLDFRPERKGPYGRFVVTQWRDGKS